MWRTFAAASLGLALGMGMGAWSLPSSARVAVDPAPALAAPPPPPQDARAPCPPTPAPDPGTAAALEQARLELAALRGQRTVIVGDEVPWARVAPGTPTPAAWEAAARAAVASTHPPVAFERIDCAEYPCIVIVSRADVTDPVISSAPFDFLPDALADHGLDGMRFLRSQTDEIGGRRAHFLALWSPDDVPGTTRDDLGTRVDGRIRELWTQLGSEP